MTAIKNSWGQAPQHLEQPFKDDKKILHSRITCSSQLPTRTRSMKSEDEIPLKDGLPRSANGALLPSMICMLSVVLQ